MAPIQTPDLASPKFKANPYPFYARLRAESPVHRVVLPGDQVFWIVTRYDDVSLALKDMRVSKDRFGTMNPEQQKKVPWFLKFFKPLMHHMLSQDPPNHTRLRALVSKAFSPRLIEQLRLRVQQITDQLLDNMQRKGSVDLLADYALPLPITIIAEMLGVPLSDQNKFRRWSNRLVSATTVREALTSIPAVLMFTRYIRKLIERRRASPQDDMISALVAAEEAGDKLNEEELLGMIFLLLVAGHETTVNLIATGTLALLQNPEQLERLRRDPALIGPAVEELLRFTSPVEMGTERVMREDLTLAGTTIPKGDMLVAAIGSANRDETQFKDPDTLDLGREPNKHLAFGLGIHYCLGAPLARLEGQIALQSMVERLPRLRLARPAESLRWRRGALLRGLRALPVMV
jgi:cytochrome P450